MERPFIFGLRTSIRDSVFQTTESLFESVGHNTGNLAFHYAIDRQLGSNLRSVNWDAPVDAIRKTGKLAVIPCANQLGPHLDYGSLSEKFRQIDLPMVSIGLGAQGASDMSALPEVPAGTLEWVRAIAARASSAAPNIAVRGPFTLRVLEHYGLAQHAVVTGCPTLFINPDPSLGRRIAANLRAPRRIAVTAGHQGWTHLGRIENSLAQMVSVTQGSYVGQSALEMVMLTRGEAERLSAAQLIKCRDYVAPAMELDEFIHWSKTYGNVFFDVCAWMEHYRRFDFVVGTRIHGVMLALQAGVPALCIAHDSRTLELCQTMAIPHVAASKVGTGITRASLLPLFNFDAAAFDSNRRELCARYLQFLTANGLAPAPWLSRIAAPQPATGEVR